MTTMLRWLIRISFTVAALCFAFVAFTCAEQSRYRAAAGTLAAAVRTNGIPQPRLFESPVPAPVPTTPHLEMINPVASAVVAAAPGLLGELDVPQLRISTAIVEGDDATALRRGAGHLRGTAMPGEAGNVVLAGHRDTVFRRLGELQRGDRLRLTTARGVFELPRGSHAARGSLRHLGDPALGCGGAPDHLPSLRLDSARRPSAGLFRQSRSHLRRLVEVDDARPSLARVACVPGLPDCRASNTWRPVSGQP